MLAPAPAASPRAGFVTRLAAALADALILLVLLRGSAWFLTAAAKVLRRFAPPVNLGTVVLVCAPLIVAAYQVAFWRLRGQTPGKWLLGVRVVPVGGGKLPLGRALLRLGGYLLSALPFYAGFLWILGPERRGLHDRLARTEVVYARERTRRRPAEGTPSTSARSLSAA
jgi:uncharacterized RDD family membrane protein YckC